MCQAKITSCPSGTIHWLSDKLNLYVDTFVVSAKGRDDLVSAMEKVCEAVSAFLSLGAEVGEIAKAAADFGKAAKTLRGAGTIFGFPMSIREGIKGWTGLMNRKSSVNQLSGEQKVFFIANLTTNAAFMTFMAVLVVATLAKKTAMLARMGKATPWLKLANSGSSLLSAGTNVLSEENTINLLRKQLHDKCNPELSDDEKLIDVERQIEALRNTNQLQAQLQQIRTLQGMKIAKEIMELTSILAGLSGVPYNRQIAAGFGLGTGFLSIASDIYSTEKGRQKVKAGHLSGKTNTRVSIQNYAKTITNGESKYRLECRGAHVDDNQDNKD